MYTDYHRYGVVYALQANFPLYYTTDKISKIHIYPDLMITHANPQPVIKIFHY